MADARGSGPRTRKGVEVRLLSSAFSSFSLSFQTSKGGEPMPCLHDPPALLAFIQELMSGYGWPLSPCYYLELCRLSAVQPEGVVGCESHIHNFTRLQVLQDTGGNCQPVQSVPAQGDLGIRN